MRLTALGGMPKPRPSLTISLILSWIDDHRQRFARWPHSQSGTIVLSAIFNWRKIDNALRYGFFGLEGGSSLAKLLHEHRGVRNWPSVPDLTEAQILAWADAHRAAHGRWPTCEGGKQAMAPGESWRNINAALHHGLRGLPKGSSLAELLARHRGHRHNLNAPKLTIKRILGWADKHFARTEKCPTKKSGQIEGVSGEPGSGPASAVAEYLAPWKTGRRSTWHSFGGFAGKGDDDHRRPVQSSCHTPSWRESLQIYIRVQPAATSPTHR